MSMSSDLRDRIAAVPAAAGRVYRDERPQGSPLPNIVLFVVADPRPVTHDGPQRLRETRVQIDVRASSRGAADDLAETVISAATPAGTHGQTKFARSFVEDVRTFSERPTETANLFTTSLDLAVWHQPAN